MPASDKALIDSSKAAWAEVKRSWVGEGRGGGVCVAGELGRACCIEPKRVGGVVVGRCDNVGGVEAIETPLLEWRYASCDNDWKRVRRASHRQEQRVVATTTD